MKAPVLFVIGSGMKGAVPITFVGIENVMVGVALLTTNDVVIVADM